MNTAKRILTIILILVSSIAVFAGIYGLIVYMSANTILLDETKLKQNFNRYEFYDAKGDLIECPTSNYHYTEFDELGQNVINAFVSVEDKRFFDHNGIDVIRLIKASIKNLFTMSYKEGASTISQQLVKNTLLNSEKRISRKLKEINITMRLEKKYSKEEILSMYLSAIYFGDGAYGITNASYHYFGKKPAELSVEEAATLAGLIKAPSLYSPTKDENKSRERRNVVLKAMERSGYINDKRYEELVDTKIALSVHEINKQNPYITLAESEVERILGEKSTDKAYEVYTYYDDFNGKIASLTSKKYAGGELIIGKSGEVIYLNETSVGLINKRGNVASLIKPLLVYAPCFEEGVITSTTYISDAKTDFNGYSPSNYKNIYYGNVSVKTALSKSLNTVAVKLYNTLSEKQIKKYSSRLGVELTENDGLSAALGATEKGITPLEIASSYTLFLNGGERISPSTIKRIEDDDGNVLYEREILKQRVFSEETAYIISTFLEETAKSGTAKKLNKLPITLYAKTGTNGDDTKNSDCYSIAYDDNFIVMSFITSIDGNIIPKNVGGGSIPTDNVASIFGVIESVNSPITKPDGVVKLSIDKYLTEKEGKTLLASSDTPKVYVLEEYFSVKNAPSETSTIFSFPIVEKATLYLDNESVILSLDTKPIYNYKLTNSITGEELGIIEGHGNTIEFEVSSVSGDIRIEITPFVVGGKIGSPYITNTIYKTYDLF